MNRKSKNYFLFKFNKFKVVYFMLALIFMLTNLCINVYSLPMPYGARLAGNYIDRGIDSNKDGLFDFLVVEIGVNLATPGEYSVWGVLNDRNDREIIWSIDHENLSAGYNIMHLNFDGKTIASHGVDGYYLLKNLTLSYDSSDTGLCICDSLFKPYATHAYNATDFIDPSAHVKLFSGAGSGEVLLNFTVHNTVPVFSGSYTYDLVGIHIPPIETFNVSSSDKSGYSYTFPSIYIPGKPNNFTVTASKVKNLNIGLKKLQGSYANSSMVWMGKYTRIWVTLQILADKNGAATTTSDLLSPGIYQVKIFGDAAENVTQVNLTMTLVKKIVVSGPFKLSLNTTGFPSGKYLITAKALNGTFSLDELAIGDLN